MARTDTSTPVLRIADLNERRPTRFELSFDAAQIRQFAEELDLISLKKLRFKGELTSQRAGSVGINRRFGGNRPTGLCH